LCNACKAYRKYTLHSNGTTLQTGPSGDAVGELFDCDPTVTDIGDRTRCTNESNGNTFSCFVNDSTVITINLTCDRLIQPPSGNGGDGGGAGGGAPFELTQETEQEAESGDIDQSFEITSEGDNSNQCAGVQGVANTGNPQNVTDLLQYASEADEFEFEEVGSDITVSPESASTCDQQVNQAASASG
jgi:hypothetical protein